MTKVIHNLSGKVKELPDDKAKRLIAKGIVKPYKDKMMRPATKKRKGYKIK